MACHALEYSLPARVDLRKENVDAAGDLTHQSARMMGMYFVNNAIGLLAAGVIGAQVFVAGAAARTFKIPPEQPVATVDIPDSWRPTPVPNGVEGSTGDGAARLAVAYVVGSDPDAASGAAVKQLADHGVSVDPASRRSAPRRFNGRDALKLDFSGRDAKGAFDVAVMLVAAPGAAGFVAICCWGDDDALESVSNDLLSIADSVAPAK
jgi:hypothetical protein